ncbi:hypothetical protein JCM10212_003218 [Sporobolomyces blumeae]
MASSLSETCNASKHHYDTCFNHWLKSYLVTIAPPLSHPSDTPAGVREREQRQKVLDEHKDRLDRDCGKLYAEYQTCLKSAIQGVEGLPELLAGARREEPLDGWGGIKVTTLPDSTLASSTLSSASTSATADPRHSVTSQVLSLLNSTLPYLERGSDKVHHSLATAVEYLQESDNVLVHKGIEWLSHPRVQACYASLVDFVLTHLSAFISVFALVVHLSISHVSHRRQLRATQRRIRSNELQRRADMTDYGLGQFARNAWQGISGGGGRDDEQQEKRRKDDHGFVEVQWGREKIRVPLPPPSSPLSTLKSALYTITGVPPDHQKLIYSGAVLKDDLAPLTSFGLADGPIEPSGTNDDDDQDDEGRTKTKSFWDSWSLTGKSAAGGGRGRKVKKLVMLGSADVSARVDDRLATRKDLQDLNNANASAAGGGASVEEKKVESEQEISNKIRQISTEKLRELEPQVAQVESWIAQQRDEQGGGADARAGEHGGGGGGSGTGAPPPRILLYLSEVLLQGLLKLDGIEIPSTYADARKERKEAVKQVQDVLDRVDRAKDEWKKGGLS